MKKYLLIPILSLILWGCEDYDHYVPEAEGDIAPSQVSDIEVEEIPGGAIFSYTLPDDKSLLYVLASYEIKEGVKAEEKASYYKNTLTVQGFNSSKEQTVHLQTVSRGGKKSEPVSVSIHPLTPPFISVFRSLKTSATFGGLNVQFENKGEDDLKITIISPDSLGDYSMAERNYTNAKKGNFSARGFDSTRTKFGVYVEDRWSNFSDTLFTVVKPLYEEEIDKSKFSPVHLANDTYEAHRGFKSLEALWDGLEAVRASAFQTKPGSGMPQWFTFDLGTKVVLSRFKMFHKMKGAFNGGDPKKFEVWGSNNPSSDGSWDNWHLLGTFENDPPSGQIPATNEDSDYAINQGTDHEFPVGNEAYRYIRFKTLETWGGVDFVYIGELTFWGSHQ